MLATSLLFGFLLCWSTSFASDSECASGYWVISVSNTSSCEKTKSTCLFANGTVPCCTLERVLLGAAVPLCSRVVVETDQKLDRSIVVNGSRDLVLQGNGPAAV